ncbi:MAG: PD40 domain-containing protein [Acidobacteria bacterium]|nr:PD40 domain-containing protein [Acidobacteriota bacterium]
MRKLLLKGSSGLLLFSILFLFCCNNEENKDVSIFQDLDGPYLGQKPPGRTPEIFAPDIISTGLGNGHIYFINEGREVYFNNHLINPHYVSLFFYSHMKDGKWTEPVEVPLKRLVYHRPAVNPDGSKLFCISSTAAGISEEKSKQTNLYCAEKTEAGWSELKKVDVGDDFPYSFSQTSMAANGNIYFQTGYRINGHEDIFMAEYIDGRYRKPVRLGDAINTPGHELHPFIALDESYLIFDAAREGGFGKNDLYISFKKRDGEWTKAVNMGQIINSERDERWATVSSDGKYLFFISYPLDRSSGLPDKEMTLTEFRDYVASYKNGSSIIYWVDAGIIDELKQKQGL